MRQVHRAGDKLYVDYSGKKPRYVDGRTGEVIEVELFVAVLGASSYTYAEATLSQRAPDFIGSHQRAFAYFGGVPSAVVPDQLRTGISAPCLYEPGVQRTYGEMAQHYGTVVVPARPAHPRDKAKVEVGVQVAQRWILARLRNETIYSLTALNERIWALLEDLNGREMKRYGESRRQLFERIDRPALRPLPTEAFIYGEWKAARVNIDYHVEIEHHYYSVPHALVHEKVEVRVGAATVEIFHRGLRVTSHARSFARARHTTVPAHMPRAHQAHLEWSPTRLIRWAATVGKQTEVLVTSILNERPHPEQGYRSCLGILRLGKRFGPERLEAACARAVAVEARSGARSSPRFRIDSTFRRGASSIALSSDSSRPVDGSTSTRSWSSLVRRGLARRTSRARSRNRPAARATPRSTVGPLASSASSLSPRPTARTRGC
jgi:transposase